MNRNDFDLNLLIGLLSLASSVLGIMLTLLIAAFGPLAGLTVLAFITGATITGTVMWLFQRRGPP
jgi:ABC-type tungstate transport system substrate-binding protein